MVKIKKQRILRKAKEKQNLNVLPGRFYQTLKDKPNTIYSVPKLKNKRKYIISIFDVKHDKENARIKITGQISLKNANIKKKCQ